MFKLGTIAILCFLTDYDECAGENGGCEQRCVNTIPGHVCECNPGYDLNTDNKSCVANADCSEGMCYCLDGFIDINDSQNDSLNCVGKSHLLNTDLLCATK